MRYLGLLALKSQDKKSPPSQMLRVPTVLIPVVKELARLHSPGHTKALLHGLQELIANIDSNSDIDVGALGEAVKQLALWVESLESQLASYECCDCLLGRCERERHILYLIEKLPYLLLVCHQFLAISSSPHTISNNTQFCGCVWGCVSCVCGLCASVCNGCVD